MLSFKERLSSLRQLMARYQLDACILPSNDPHQSEYVADHWKTREWISGFSGSAGVVVVTQDHAGLWTDSRYFLQAEQELKQSGLVLHKQGIPHAPEHLDWVFDNLPESSKVGVDGMLFSELQVNQLRAKFATKNITLHTDLDFIEPIWPDRPPLPQSAVFEMSTEQVGQSRSEKLALIQNQLEPGAYYLITALDSIAWVLNIRAADVPYNPVCISYLLVGKNSSHWFVDGEKVNADLQARLAQDAIQLHPYGQISDFLQQLKPEAMLAYSPALTSSKLLGWAKAARKLQMEDLITPAKAIKNATEIAQLKKAMIKDGVALLRLFRWLENGLQEKTILKEYDISLQLDAFRREQGDYFGESFATIAGYAANGAIIHYHPDSQNSAIVRSEGILLLDSGGQYLQGTTDITRTIALGQPSDDQKKHYTLVLKGHIALAKVRFLAGTKGAQLDTLARLPLWSAGLNYGHGTGHGVGAFLNVHEGPQGLTHDLLNPRGQVAFVPGMLTSNEPGFYLDGQYGIRIENLILCVESSPSDYGQYLEFETLSLFPINLEMADLSLLNADEKAWLNDYHQQVFATLAPHLKPEEVAWLEKQCQSIE
ncbi:MAG TPA: aminopeptidase P family protein [Saprospiraceae bacterium]|nr:aminopeptidase P family protein [Saprospiraceae bacterium]HMQ85001.1 aminopeptidase P family protein [Saprospiraceae bacterium]